MARRSGVGTPYLIAGGLALALLVVVKRKDITKVTGTAAMAWRGGQPIGPIILKHVGNNQYLEASRAEAFLAMQAAAKQDGVTLLPVSGFRSVAEQTVLYAKYVARLYAAPKVAKPGYSNHSAGDALDIQIPPAGTAPDDPRRIESREYQWLQRNGPKFGFNNDFAAHRETWHFSTTGRSWREVERDCGSRSEAWGLWCSSRAASRSKR